MRRAVAVVAALALVPASAAVAQQVKSPEGKQEEKKICKPDPEATDSRIRPRICKTESEWRQGAGSASQSRTQDSKRAE